MSQRLKALEEGTQAAAGNHGNHTDLVPETKKGDPKIDRIPGIRELTALSSHGIVSKCLLKVSQIFQKTKKNLDPKDPSGYGNMFFLICCVIAISLDPLFFYIPMINDDKKCLRLDNKLGITASAIRSVFDLFYVLYIVFRLRDDFFLPLMTCRGSDEVDENRLATAKKYLLCFFLVDFPSILPLPQIVTWIMIQTKGGPEFLTMLKFFVFFQYVPRLFRIYPLTSDVPADIRWVKVMFNLLLYMLVSHVFGAFWYFLSIERMVVCWKRACVNNTQCNPSSSFYCNDSREDQTFVNDFCPVTTPNTTIFDFGIFHDALRSGIVESTDFLQKFVHCFQWSLQNLSCFGQNLQPSTYVWENLFVILITVSGLVLFVLLIGNIQTYLQSETMRKEETRLKAQDIEQWMSLHGLPENLKQQVKKHQEYVLQKTRGVDVENLLNNLPKDLRINIKHKLYLDLLKKVNAFRELKKETVEKLCECVKPVHFIDRNIIVREGDPLDEMLFIVEGKVKMYPSKGKTKIQGEGKFFGEELVAWAQYESDFPRSPYTIQALEKVEAVALKADDLRDAYERDHLYASKQMNIPMFVSIKHAARVFASNWRQKSKKDKKNLGDSDVMSSQMELVSLCTAIFNTLQHAGIMQRTLSPGASRRTGGPEIRAEEEEGQQQH